MLFRSDEKFAVENREWVEILVDTVKESISYMSEMPEKVKFVFDDEIEIEEEAQELLQGEQVPQLFNGIIDELNTIEEIDMEYSKTFMKTIQKATGIKGKNLYMPTRAVITGNVHGPEMVNIIYLLGKDKIIKRVEKLLNK